MQHLVHPPRSLHYVALFPDSIPQLVGQTRCRDGSLWCLPLPEILYAYMRPPHLHINLTASHSISYPSHLPFSRSRRAPIHGVAANSIVMWGASTCFKTRRTRSRRGIALLVRSWAEWAHGDGVRCQENTHLLLFSCCCSIYAIYIDFSTGVKLL
jgi:hypothetical protein